MMSDCGNEFEQFCDICRKCDDVSQITAIVNDELICIYGFEMLNYAVAYERLSIMTYLMDGYPNLILQQDENGYTILFFAVTNGSYKSMDHMLQRAPQLIRIFANNGSTVFHLIARRQDVPFEILDTLLECDLKTNGPLYVLDIPQQSSFAVHHAAACNNVMFLARAYAQNPDNLLVRTRNRGYTVLHVAIAHLSEDCVCYLLETCPHLCKYEDFARHNALHLAVSNANIAVVDQLIDCDNTIITSSTQSVLWLAMRSRSAKIAAKLLKMCPQVANERYDSKGNTLDCNEVIGETTLHLAAQLIRDNYFITSLMCIQPDLLEQVNNNKKTALHIANKYNNREAIESIIAFCPNVSYTDEDDNTPLHLMLRTNAPTPVVMSIFHHNPSHMYSTNASRQTPLHLCISNGRNPDIFESYLRLEFLVDVYTECKLDLSHLFLKVQNQFSNCYLLRELQTIIFQYLGFFF